MFAKVALAVVFSCYLIDHHIWTVGGGYIDPVVINALDNGPSFQNANHNISVVGDNFVLDGKVLKIISGSLHYFRLPSAYWRDRLRKLKAGGLNAVSTYVEWSYHEPEEGQYMFEGDRDVARFVQIAAEEGLHVLLRPGPYICAERDLGGLPYWLLGKYPNIKLRTVDKDFIDETKIWMTKLFTYLKPLLIGNGGPIILVQVENEYGSYGRDKEYMGSIRDIILDHIGNKALLYTTDGTDPQLFLSGSINGAVPTIDFGSYSNVTKVLNTFRRYFPHGPLMNSEFYSGWLTHWNETLQQTSGHHLVNTLRILLNNNFNVNFYMFFGGTNFEFTSGANYDRSYLPDITSYDYDAPLSEAGDPTDKYYLIRNTLAEYDPELRNIPLPVPSKKEAYGEVTLQSRGSILSTKGRKHLGKQYKDVTGSVLPTFESLRQRAGLLLYETIVNETDGELKITKPRDMVYVYVDGELQGSLYRGCKQYTLNLKCKPGSRLSLLVENQGRINYGNRIHDYKGILSTVKINNNVLGGKWFVTGYPLVFNGEEKSLSNDSDPRRGPVLFEGTFNVAVHGNILDTYLDTTGWGKGYVWINGYNLGRYWPSVGPQVTLYVPGVWLRQGINDILILELEDAPKEPIIQFIDVAILNRRGIMCKLP
ncbi:beta-galactosidase-like [Battus philenor]|uniref:beta-galactosidase-like n=1 Tax=Battus philenor TaxID=42288 RepID=UPI0035D02CE5